MLMTLDDYLKREGNSEAGLAVLASTSPVSINRILHGEQKPSADMIRAIVEATNGSVTADDLIFGAPRKRKERAKAA
jgi:transcriptional regulator with XRE-family HTH domain